MEAPAAQDAILFGNQPQVSTHPSVLRPGLEDDEGREDPDHAGEPQRHRRQRRGQANVLKHPFAGGQLDGHHPHEAQHRAAAQPHVQPAALGSLLAPHAKGPRSRVPPARCERSSGLYICWKRCKFRVGKGGSLDFRYLEQWGVLTSRTAGERHCLQGEDAIKEVRKTAPPKQFSCPNNVRREYRSLKQQENHGQRSNL